MRRLAVLICALVAFASSARATVEQDYLQIYLKLNDSERLERDDDLSGALAGYLDCFTQLDSIHTANPHWQNVLVMSRLSDCLAKIERLEATVHARPPPPDSDLETVIKWNHSHPSPKSNEAVTALEERLHAISFRDSTPQYPWKNYIVTTVFWIGSDSPASGWNPHWVKDNGGADDEFDMSGYASGEHASMLNPFYAALPFNDLAHPELAERWLPTSWAPPSAASHTSVCKDRWIEIKNRAGRVCFAQWEDVGPIATDDVAYVFGGNRPKASRGLNVSPAVAKYLGVPSTGLLSWRFVDDQDVQPGLWTRYDEQAVLFRAMHQKAKDTTN